MLAGMLGLVEIIAAFLSGISMLLLYNDMAHLVTVCSLLFALLTIFTVFYVCSITFLCVVNFCPKNDHSSKGATEGDHPLINSAAAVIASSDIPVVAVQYDPNQEERLCSKECRTKRGACTSCCSVLALILAVLAGIIHFQIIGNKRGPTLVHGLDHPVTATIDADGLLHIVGETHHDVHFSQGLLTAELRLWEMEFQRRVGRGTLSELVGKAGLGHDKMSRTLGLYASAERAVASLEGYAAAAIQSYTDGVNEYLRSNATLPFEMILLGVDRYNIDPWMPADSLVWGKIMALELSGNMKVEWMRYQLLAGANLTVDEVNQIIAPFDTLKFPTVLTTDDLNTTSLRDHLHVVDAAAAVPSKEAQDFYESYRGSAKIPSSSFSSSATSSSASDHHRVVRLLRSEEGHGASNNWVVGGSRTTTNKPMLANDPHLQLTAPSVWIATHLKVEPKPTTKAQRNTTVTTPMDVWGAAFAGMPGIVTGRNAHIAWGVTNTGVDVQDLFIMEEDMKKHPGEYMWNGVWIKYMTRKEIIHIKNSESLTIIVRTSNAGVVITDNSVASQLGCMKELAKNLGPGQETMSLKWVSIDPTIPDVSPASFFNINLATTYDEYRKALRGYVAPAQNFIYADIHGNIGYQMPGFVPRRAAGHTGKMPVSGNGKYAWRTTSSPSADGADGSGLITDKIPFDHMPRAYNPKKGFFASANNRVVPPFNDITGKDPFAKDGYVLSHDWDGSNMGYRSRSITNMIKDLSDVGGSATVGTAAGTTDSPLKKMNMTGMRDMQKSYVSGLWIDFSPYLNSMLMSPVTLSDAAKKWIPRLTDNITFGGDMAVGAVEPTVFQKWLLQVLELVSKVSTNDNNERSCYLPKRMFNVVWVLKAMEMGHTACGGKGEAHDCLAYAANILNDVVKEYEDETVAVPRWGIDVHRALFEHQILHTTPLACLGDRQVEHGGDDSTINVGHVGSDSMMTQTAGPSYRHLVDLSSPDQNSLFLNPLGQSGDMFNFLYDNLLEMWSNAEYMNMGRYEDKMKDLNGNDVRYLKNRD